MPGPASAELTTGKSIRQLELQLSSFHLFPEFKGTFATQQLDGMGKVEGGTSSMSHTLHAKYCRRTKRRFQPTITPM